MSNIVNFKDKVIYQIYPKSFNDSNGDGLGDLRGVAQKLDYLKYLGVDYIWLTPVYVSPQRDNGYDIQNYFEIDYRYGTMEDFEYLVEEAKKRDIEIMLDMVLNHTSTSHAWFQKALTGDPTYTNYYFFKENKGKVPTNWESKFGGSAWKYVNDLDMYYLHLFDETQADLNWDNPRVRDEMVKIVNFWLAKGVKGFRFDVVNLISKPEEFEDDHIGDGRRFYTDGKHVHEYLQELNQRSFGTRKDIMTVGEMSSTTLDNCVKFASEKEDELDMVFNFHHLKVDYKDGDKWKLKDFDFLELKNLFDEWQVGMQNHDAWNALFWCNHDQPRIVSRFGDDTNYRKESSKMLATTIHMMRGIPYIYQGEEIGMTNNHFNSLDKYRDIESLNYYNILSEKGEQESDILKVLEERSRDNSRSPMQWDTSSNAGFSEGTPWIDVNPNYSQINVQESIADEDSVLNYYRKLIELRKQYKIIQEGKYESMYLDHTQIFAYKRTLGSQELVVFANFYGQDASVDFDLSGYELLLSNYNDNDEVKVNLRPYEVIVLIK